MVELLLLICFTTSGYGFHTHSTTVSTIIRLQCFELIMTICMMHWKNALWLLIPGRIVEENAQLGTGAAEFNSVFEANALFFYDKDFRNAMAHKK